MSDFSYFTEEEAQEIRACSRRYIDAVIDKHPELRVFLPDEHPPEIFEPYPPPASIDEIARWVAHKHDVKLHRLRGPRGFKAECIARFEAYYLCRQWLPVSLPMIGKYFGDRDHSTVMSGIKRHMKLNGLPRPEHNWKLAA